MRSQTLLTIIVTALITAVVSGGGVYFWQNQEQTSVNTPVSTTESQDQTIVKESNISGVREIFPNGYVINDQLFFSPTLGLAFTGVLKTLKFENNLFTTTDLPGFIQVFQNKDKEAILETIKEVVKNEGKNPDDCRFFTKEISGKAEVHVVPKETYEPSEAELFALRQKTNPELKTLDDYRKFCNESPECLWDKDSLLEANTVKYCSKYAVFTTNDDDASFQYATEGAGSETFVFIDFNQSGGERSWIGHLLLPVEY